MNAPAADVPAPRRGPDRLRVHAFRPAHLLLDLRLFRNRNLTVATGVMFLFAAAFFGALLLVPTYFQQIRGGMRTLHAGLLMAAPQGTGAMVTMPIAGDLVDTRCRSGGSRRSGCSRSSPA